MYPEPSTAQKIISQAATGATKRLTLIRKNQKRALGINTPGFHELFLYGGGPGTASGVNVNEHNALKISSVFQCVRVISDTKAKLPLFVCRRTANGKEHAVDHPLFDVLHASPNPIMTASTFKRTMQGHLCLWGNAFAWIIRNGAGQVVELWPLRPDRMRLQLFNEKLFYYYTFPDGGERQLSEVFHLRGLSSDGLVGYSPISLQREKLGLAKVSEEYRARFFSNDAKPGGVIKHPAQLSDAAHDRLKKNWNERYEGAHNRGRVAILDENMSWQDVGVPPGDAQYIEGEEFEKADIAAIFGVPAYKIGLMKPGTVSYASVEQQAIDWVVDGVMPWAVAWEEQINLSLLTRAERRNYYVKFALQALLRGDSKTRGAFYWQQFQMGALSPNEILELEDRNTIGPEGNRRFIQSNMVPLDKVDEMLAQKKQPVAEPDDEEEPAPITVNSLQNGHANGVAK